MDRVDFEALVGMRVTAWRLRQRMAAYQRMPAAGKYLNQYQGKEAEVPRERAFHAEAVADLDRLAAYYRDRAELERVVAEEGALLDRIVGIPAQPDAEEAL